MIKKHIQTLTIEHGEASNCYQAVLACLLNVELWQVPNFALFYNYDNWQSVVQRWLKEYHNVKEVDSVLLEKYHKGWMHKFPKNLKDVPYMVTGRGLKKHIIHVVIYMNGQPLHDPYPGNMPINVQTASFSYLKQI